MKFRQRNRSKLVLGGTYLTNGVVTGTETFSARDDSCGDYIEKKKRKSPIRLLPDSNCDINHKWRVPPVYSAKNSNFEVRGVRPEKAETPSYDGYPARGTGQRDTENVFYVNQLLARTHPFRSEYSVPVSMVEMLDIASLFKVAARSFSELVGSSYLQYRFGILQFVQDLNTLSSITKAIEARVKELSSLNQHGGLRRNVKLAEFPYTTVQKDKVIWSTFGFFVQADLYNSRRYTIRGSVRWRWKDGVTVSLTKLEAFNEAVKAVFDLGELDASTLWNAIPWTWLVDYFVDVNSWLQANENTNWVEPYDICIIRKMKTRTEYRNCRANVGFCQGGHLRAHLVSRDANLPVGAVPAVRFSLLTRSQVEVIFALLGKFRR